MFWENPQIIPYYEVRLRSPFQMERSIRRLSSFTSAERPKVPFIELIQTRTVTLVEPPMFRKLAGKCDFDLWTNRGYLLANNNVPVKFEGKGPISYWEINQKLLLFIWSMWS
jgi:hypothetical protein